MKKTKFFLLVLAIVSVLSCQKRQADNTGRISSGLQPGEVKIMSFNVRGYTNETDPRDNWAMRAGAVRDMFFAQKATLIGTQEVSESTEWPYIYGVLSPRGYAALSSDDPACSILYLEDELELQRTGVFWQSDTPDRVSECWDGYERIVRWAEFAIKSNGARFFYVDSHLGLTSDSRRKGITLILKRIKTYNTDNLQVVFNGDCNTTSSDGIFDELKKTMVNARDAAPVTDNVNTYNAWGNESKAGVIDHIWMSNTLQPSIYRTVTDKYDGHKFISDHYPVYTIVKF